MEHHDVVVVGAGISGIGAGYWLQRECPDRTYTILEARDALGGTWDLFRYPGVRSDSDMHTLGFSFKPWVDEKAIADGPSILSYLHETAREFGIDQNIQYRRRLIAAAWSGAEQHWTLTIEHARDDAADEQPPNTSEMTCSFLFMCSGYYSYRGGYLPDFPGVERFKGTVVHPQEWPEDLDYAGKRVIVIGSGATAMTLIPAMAPQAGHITMLQRSPTYVVARPDRDEIANKLRKVLPDKAAYRVTRAKNIVRQQLVYSRAMSKPQEFRKLLLGGVRKALGDEMTDSHFTPSYNPWEQRLCLIPNGDLYDAINEGKASVVTGQIETWDETGIELTSGKHLDADIIITATGLNLVTLGEASFTIDGEPVDFADTYTYKGLMYSGVPNLVSAFGYINASWTLRADLTAQFVCRVLNHMTATGTTQVTPTLKPSEIGMPTRPWVENFSSGYMERSLALMPKQGDHAPWTNPQRYLTDLRTIRRAPLEDGTLQFTR